jgi:WD40 repeat protein
MKKTKKQLPPLLSQWLSRQALTLGIRTIQTEVTEPDYWVPENLPGNDGKGCLGVLRPEKPEEYACRIAINHDANRLYTGHPNGNVRAWDLKTGMSLWNVKANEKKIWDITLSPNGRRLASGSGDKTIRIWDPETGTELHRLEGHSSSVNSVSFSPDGRRLASGSDDQTIRIWDPETGTELHRLEGHSDWVRSVSFSPDGRRLVSGSHDQTIRIWDPETGTELHRLEGHSKYVNSVSFSPDGRRLASGSSDQTIRIWDPETGTELQRLEGHSHNVWSVSFSPDGRRLASGSWDQTIRIWDPETGTEMHRFTFSENYAWRVAWAPSGAFLVSANRNDTVRIWDTRTPEMRRPSPAPVPLKAASSNKKPPARYMSLPKTWSILHRMKIDLPLSLIADLNALLGNEQPDSLKPLFDHKFIRRLISLRWPTPARTALIALLLHGWDCGPEWRPPKDMDTYMLQNNLIDALSGESCQPESPDPPLAFLKVAANAFDDRMITLLRALGPKTVISETAFPLQLRREVGKIPILSQPQRRLLSAQIIPMSAGTAQGSGIGIDRSGYSRSGKLTALLPSQYNLPDDVLLWRYINGGLLYRARTGQEPPQLRPVIIVLDTSAATLGPIGAVTRPAALALATSLSQKYVPSIFLSAGDEKVFLMQTPTDRLKLLTHRHGKLGDPVKSIQKAEKLLDSLRNEHPLEPVILLLTHSFWGSEFEDAPQFKRLRGLFIHYPNSNPRPPWANRCERWDVLKHSDIHRVHTALGRLIG